MHLSKLAYQSKLWAQILKPPHHVAPNSQQVARQQFYIFITLTYWWYRYAISPQTPPSSLEPVFLSLPPSLLLSLPLSSLSIIVSLDRMKSCFDSGYCATGIWELFFLVWIAQSRCQRSAAERPPYNSLEINSSRDFRGPGRPDMKRRWYLWYGMLSRNLYIKPKHRRPHSWPWTKPLTSSFANFSWQKSFFG